MADETNNPTANAPARSEPEQPEKLTPDEIAALRGYPDRVRKALEDGKITFQEAIDLAQKGWELPWAKLWAWGRYALLFFGVSIGSAATGIAVTMALLREPEPPAPAPPTPAPAPAIDLKPLIEKLDVLGSKFDAGNRKILDAIKAAPVPVPPVPPKPAPDPVPVDVGLPPEVVAKVGEPVYLKATVTGKIRWLTPPGIPAFVKEYGDELSIVPKVEGQFAVGLVAIVNGEIAPAVWTLVKCGVTPRPPPDPKPDPKPPVPTPDVQLNELGYLVLTQALKVGRKAEAAGLAGSYSETVAAIRAGSVVTPAAAVQMLLKRNGGILGANTQHWAGFSAWADNELTRRHEKGMLTTMAQHADAFEQFAAALRKAGE